MTGSNQIEAVDEGVTFTYGVTLRQHGSCLDGTLTDSGAHAFGPIWGMVNKNHITINFTYPAIFMAGTRTFSGTINWRGYVSGWWNETGSQNDSGTWTLADGVSLACPGPVVWWNQNSACPVPLPPLPPPHHHHHHI